MSIQAGSSIFAAESNSTDLFVSSSPPNSASSCDMEPLAAPESLGFGFRSLACRVRRHNIAAIKASPITVPVTMIPGLAPARRPVFGVDEGCGKTVVVSGKVMDEEFVKGLKEVDAGDVIVKIFVKGLKEVDAGDVIVKISIKGLKEVDAGDSVVEARDGFVEEGTDKSGSTTADEEPVNCSGEGASKVSLLGIEQSSDPPP